jgi:hypothetical protein
MQDVMRWKQAKARTEEESGNAVSDGKEIPPVGSGNWRGPVTRRRSHCTRQTIKQFIDQMEGTWKSGKEPEPDSRSGSGVEI